jgi:hypothetical protein
LRVRFVSLPAFEVSARNPAFRLATLSDDRMIITTIKGQFGNLFFGETLELKKKFLKTCEFTSFPRILLSKKIEMIA